MKKTSSRNFRLTLLLNTALLLGGCIGNMYLRMTHLSEKDLVWFDNFIQNDSSFFMSGNGDVSRLIVERCTVINTAERFFVSANHPILDYFMATASVCFRMEQSGCPIFGFFTVTKPVDTDSLAMNGMLGNREESFHPSHNDASFPDALHVFRYNGYIFPECYIMDSSNSGINHFLERSDSIERMVISRDEGIIYYSYSSGKEFFRVFDESIADSLRKETEKRKSEETQRKIVSMVAK